MFGCAFFLLLLFWSPDSLWSQMILNEVLIQMNKLFWVDRWFWFMSVLYGSVHLAEGLCGPSTKFKLHFAKAFAFASIALHVSIGGATFHSTHVIRHSLVARNRWYHVFDCVIEGPMNVLNWIIISPFTNLTRSVRSIIRTFPTTTMETSTYRLQFMISKMSVCFSLPAGYTVTQYKSVSVCVWLNK